MRVCMYPSASPLLVLLIPDVPRRRPGIQAAWPGGIYHPVLRTSFPDPAESASNRSPSPSRRRHKLRFVYCTYIQGGIYHPVHRFFIFSFPPILLVSSWMGRLQSVQFRWPMGIFHGWLGCIVEYGWRNDSIGTWQLGYCLVRVRLIGSAIQQHGLHGICSIVARKKPARRPAPESCGLNDM
ncbi:hypothetical protein BDD12DRAFT_281172 [Trichophaea hybrida]|nr:hypothetical protein BDD12DRAFT_281172 [Trichophaea hybrida]